MGSEYEIGGLAVGAVPVVLVSGCGMAKRGTRGMGLALTTLL